MKNRVCLKREKLISVIEQACEKLLSNIDEFENENKTKPGLSVYDEALKEFNELKNSINEHLLRWIKALNGLKYDENNFKIVKSNCEKATNYIREKKKSFEAINPSPDKLKTEIENFEKIELEPIFQFA